MDALLPFPLYTNILLFNKRLQINETGDRGGNIWLSMHLFCCKAMLGTLWPVFLFALQKQGIISLCIHLMKCCMLMFGTLVSAFIIFRQGGKILLRIHFIVLHVCVCYSLTYLLNYATKVWVCVFGTQKLHCSLRLNGKLAFCSRWSQKGKLKKWWD